MSETRTAVRRPKWGFFPNIPDVALIEVGPRRQRYDSELGKPLRPGQDARREVYLNGERVGYVEQYTHESSVPMGRLRRVTGRPTHWVQNGKDYWRTFDQMNEAVYDLVDRRLRMTTRAGW